MTVILPRTAWTSTAPGFPRFAGRRIRPADVRFCALHYPGAGNVRYGGRSKAATAALIRGWRNYHVNGRGWADIGYPLAADQDGRLWMAAGITHAAAHSASPGYTMANNQGMAILGILGNNERPTDAMVRAMNDGIAWLRRTYPNMKQVLGHQQVRGASTACPGQPLMKLIRAGQFTGAGSAKPRPPARKGNPYRPSTDKVFGPVTAGAWQWDLVAAGFDAHSVDRSFGRYSILSTQRFLTARGYRNHAHDALSWRGSTIGSHPSTTTDWQRYLTDLGFKNHAHDGDFGPWTIYDTQLALRAGKVK